ncbi:hypothetical protein C482_14594 [Natrialba chahannaoensis JCM 10990]|uniref:Uncharacterized protein n=1 Tax=Natrialba chahannaoensis JCM 10990 TaxID=1227492 RepID=M0AI15_9EURY|nr:hypothetical protein C482_14594 [Natrialba chahannaoensis JCM 10990]
MDERRSELGHSTLTACSTKRLEKTGRVDDTQFTRLNQVRLQQPNRQMNPVDPAADDRDEGISICVGFPHRRPVLQR